MVSVLIILVLLGSVAGTVYAVRRSRNQDRAAAPAGPGAAPGGPLHAINHARCTGCSACVEACPERVLELHENRALVARIEQCVQCEACAWACPTGALVMHEPGVEPPPLLLPEVDGDCQSAVPGMYLIGEVIGQPLIKNAANLGRGVVEHMLHEGLCPGALTSHGFAEGSDAGKVLTVDVAIVGAGPGGLSAALTCIQRGLSYVLLERDQKIASTIHRYPCGTRVAAEPRDVPNLSLLPLFDGSREELLGVWRDLAKRVGLEARLGEAVEQLRRLGNGMFDVRTNVGAYRAQRVVIATGGRGKPRTLGVPGENLPKVACELGDPSAYRDLPVLVVGGGDRACEAALALADAGARVILSYRGHTFSRATPRNRAAIGDYADRRLLKLKLESQIERFGRETVTVEMSDGVRKRYPNRAAFVFIGTEPTLRWLDRLGIGFREFPHGFVPLRSDQVLARYFREPEGPYACPDAAADAAVAVLGRACPELDEDELGTPFGLVDPGPGGAPTLGMPPPDGLVTSAHFDAQPIPLSEFVSRGRGPQTHTPRVDDTEPNALAPSLGDTSPAPRSHDERTDLDAPARLMTDETPIGSPPPGLVTDTPELEAFGPISTRSNSEGSAPRKAVIVGLAKAMAEHPPSHRQTTRLGKRQSPQPIRPPFRRVTGEPLDPHRFSDLLEESERSNIDPIFLLDEGPPAEPIRPEIILVEQDTPRPRQVSLSDIDFDLD